MGLQSTADEFLLLSHSHKVGHVRPAEGRSSDLTRWRFTPSMLASDTSIEAALKPVKFFECIGKGRCDISSRFAVQPLYLDKPGTSGRIPEGASKVPYGLGVVVRALPSGGSTSCNSQPSESDVVHDHIRLRQRQIAAVACIGVRIGAGHVMHTGTTQGGEAVGSSSCRNKLSPGGGSTEMISDRGSDANRKVPVKFIGEHLLPTAQTWRLWRPSPPVRLQAPETVISTCSAISGQVRPRSRSSRICCVEAG